MNKALTIAGSDTSGGAGIQADLKTFNNYKVYGTTALTSIVTMDYLNSWAHSVDIIASDIMEKQIDTVLKGIRPQAIKSGMLPTTEHISKVSQILAKSTETPYVLDPVMACKGTEPLFPENTIAIRDLLLPFADVVTPNLFEAAQLAQMPAITTLEDAKKAAIILHELGAKYVVIKAVPFDEELLAELVFDGQAFGTFTHPYVHGKSTHGAGCTFSAAITAQLAQGKEVLASIADSSAYVYNAIQQSETINEYYGALVPLD